MAPETIAAAGAALSMVAGAVVRAWVQARREGKRETSRALAASETPARGLPVLPAPDCARHAEGHSADLARTHVRINEVLDLVGLLDKHIDTVSGKIDRLMDRVDDIKDWTRPSSGDSTPPGRKR